MNKLKYRPVYFLLFAVSGFTGLIYESIWTHYLKLFLGHAAKIHCGNALQMDWNDVVSVYEVDYILGNPPFVGAKYMTEDQRSDIEAIFNGVASYGLLDYVTAWYLKAMSYVRGDERRLCIALF